jgi:hypothetical protein
MANSFRSHRAFEAVPNHVIGQLTSIYEFKGRERLYQVQAPEILAALQSSALEFGSA